MLSGAERKPAGQYGTDIRRTLSCRLRQHVEEHAEQTVAFSMSSPATAALGDHMDTIFDCCAGLDVHQKTVWACVRRLERNGRFNKESKCFGTMTRDLLELAKWLKERGVTHAAMESTGVLWKPVYNILEEHVEVWLCNAQHIKNVPGRKTDVKDCEWIAQLLQCGLLRPSFVPPKPVRELRDLTRARTSLDDDKTRVANRIHKVLEDANIKLSAVASDILGVSGRAMLNKLIGGTSDPQELANEAKEKKPEKKEEAKAPLPFLAALKLLVEMWGLDVRSAQNVIAEIGTDMHRFPSDKHFVSWAAICPGNNRSADKNRSGATRKGNSWLKRALTQAAWAASRAKKSFFSARYKRLVRRRGAQRSIVAEAHSILKAIYHMLKNHTPFNDLSAEHYKQSVNETSAKRSLVRSLERMGYDVKLEPKAVA